MKLVQYNEYLVITVDTDGLVLWHQVISSYSDDYAPMHFQFFMDNGPLWQPIRCLSLNFTKSQMFDDFEIRHAHSILQRNPCNTNIMHLLVHMIGLFPIYSVLQNLF